MLLAIYISVSAALVVSVTGSTLPLPKQEEKSLWTSPKDVKTQEDRDLGDKACALMGGVCRPYCNTEIERQGKIGVCTGDYVCCKGYRNTLQQDSVSAEMGDPHFQTLDGTKFKFDGHDGCSYVLLQECIHVPTFVVTVRHRYVQITNKTGVSEVIVYADGNSVTTNLDMDVYLNNRNITEPFPWKNGHLKVHKYTEYVKITMDSKFSLMWNGKGRVAPTVDSSMFGKVCGLMGNADDNPDNDMQMRVPDGTLKLTDDVNRFGESWLVPGSC